MIKRIFEGWIKQFVSLMVICLISANVSFAENVDTIDEAFKGGEFSGTIGNYYEFVSEEADNANHGWSSAYITIKFETLTWNNLKFGTRSFAHGQLYSDHDNGTSDPFETDVETNFTLPEMYLNYSFLGNSSITVGRWNHKKVTHIDDAQSEGGYLSFKEIENLEFIVGAMTRFAEIDYDDGEDFGRTTDAQDVDSEDTYGIGSGPIVVFVEAKYKPIDMLKLNPYFMFHDDYASVFGVDTNVSAQWEEYDIEYGAQFNYIHVNADIVGSDDANIFVIQPFITKGPFKLDFLYSKFDDGNALNKPAWLRDTVNLIDQDVADANTGAEVFETRIKYSLDKFWGSYTFATATYDASSSEGDGSKNNEFQVGYKVTDNLDINLRYFIISFDNIDDEDYQKVESRVRFKF